MPGLDYASSRPFRTKLLHRDSLQVSCDLDSRACRGHAQGDDAVFARLTSFCCTDKAAGTLESKSACPAQSDSEKERQDSQHDHQSFEAPC